MTDARTRAYPLLPARAGVRIVVPRQGDLRLRPLVPNDFVHELHIHCPPAHRHVYRRFRVARRFIVMAETGDMFTKAAALELFESKLSDSAFLPLPQLPLPPDAVLKVLDLVQCYTYASEEATHIVPNVRWELVRVRWRRSDYETWIPIELLASQPPALLQEFYVNSINSWGFHNRVFPESWTRFRTEIELWLHQPEFQGHYNRLRRRLLQSHAMSQTNTQQQQQQRDVKDQRLTAEARANSASAPPRILPPVAASQPSVAVPRPLPQPQAQSLPQPRPQQPLSQPQPLPHPRPQQPWPQPRPQQPLSQPLPPPPPPRPQPAPQNGASQPAPPLRIPQVFYGVHSVPRSLPARPEPALTHRYLQHQPPNAHVPPPRSLPMPMSAQHYPSPFARSTPFAPPRRLPPSPPRPQEPPARQQAPPPRPYAPPLRPPVTQQPSNGAQISPHAVVHLSEIPPHPPTPPRPAQERPVEMLRPVPALSLPTRHEPAPPQSYHRPLPPPTTSTTNAEKERRRKEKRKEKEARSSSREGASPAREKETKKKKRDKESSQRMELSTPVGAKEKKEKKKKKRREASPESPRSKQRKLKRLKWSQAASESDESDDLLEFSQRTNERGVSDKQERKRLKRLRRAADRPPPAPKEPPAIIVIDDNDDDDEETAEKAVMKKKKEKKEKKDKEDLNDKKEKKKDKNRKRECEDEAKKAPEQEPEIAVEIDIDAFSDVDDDADDEQDASTDHVLVGEIRCVCGVTKVGRYTGQWLQCWKEECGVWQHAECAGYLLRRGDVGAVPEKFCCSTCDPDAFQQQCRDAKTRMRTWLSICCESHNQKQLLQLLEDEEQRDAAAVRELADSTTGANRRTLLMEAAQSGLAHAVHRLIRRYRVTVFATDAQSWNALDYAVTRESRAVVTFLMKHAPSLVRHQDLSGQMPLHRILKSCQLNVLALPLLKEDPALCVTSDFDGHMPIHFACQAVNESTLEIVRQILSVLPMHAVEKSPERLTPFLYLCAASSSADRSVLMQKAAQIAALADELLDVDALGGFLNARDPRGWTPLHFVAEAGNDMLLLDLCHRDDVAIDAVTFDSGETALHVAARANHARCIDALLTNRRRRLDVAAVDGSQWIPVLRTTLSACLQQLLYCDLDRQLVRLNTLAQNYRHRVSLCAWLRRVVRDPTCFAIVNDWLQYNLSLVDDLDALLMLDRSFVRVDCKLEYLYDRVFRSLTRVQTTTTTEITLSSATGECYWKQFVAHASLLESHVFRQRLRIAIARGDNLRLDNLTLVLVRLLAGLLQPSTGLLVRSDDDDATVGPSPHRRADDPKTLREYYVLGELVAYLVLRKVSVGEVFEFSTAFLTAVVGNAPASPNGDVDAFTLGVFAESFAAGFDAVAPATLRLLHPEELRIVLNARTHSLSDIAAVDWASTIVWRGFEASVDNTSQEDGEVCAPLVASWWRRLVQELIDDERVAFVLWLAGSFRYAQRLLAGASVADDKRLCVERYQRAEHDVSDDDALLPTLNNRTLVLPSYSSYDCFRAAVTSAFRKVI